MKILRYGCLVLLLSGCFYPAERGKLLEQRVDEQDAQLKAQQAKLDETLPKIDRKIAEVTRALDLLDKASRRSGADIGVQLQKTVEDVAGLHGQVDSYLHSLQELDQRIAALQASTDQKFADLQTQEAKREAEAKKVVRPADKASFFKLAAQKQKEGDLTTSRQLFHEFVKKWPHDELTGQAYFQLGESYYGEKACDQAVPEYAKVVVSFPHSKDAPMALVRSADCFKALGKPQESRNALEEVLRSYPKSDAARLARAKLAHPGGAKPGAKRPAK